MESKTVTIKGIDIELWEWLRIKAIKEQGTVGEVLNAILRVIKAEE